MTMNKAVVRPGAWKNVNDACGKRSNGEADELV